MVLERGDDLGGVWRDNTYPGAACDVPSHLYSFSFAPGHRWSRRFAPQRDILDHLRRVADDHGLRAALRLRTEVTEARFDDRAVAPHHGRGRRRGGGRAGPGVRATHRPRAPGGAGLRVLPRPRAALGPVGPRGGPARAPRRRRRHRGERGPDRARDRRRRRAPDRVPAHRGARRPEAGPALLGAAPRAVPVRPRVAAARAAHPDGGVRTRGRACPWGGRGAGPAGLPDPAAGPRPRGRSPQAAARPRTRSASGGPSSPRTTTGRCAARTSTS